MQRSSSSVLTITPEYMWKDMVAKSDAANFEIPETCRSSFLAFVKSGKKEEHPDRAIMWMDAANKIKFAKDSVPSSQVEGTSLKLATGDISSISAPWYPGSMIVTSKASWTPKKFSSVAVLHEFDALWAKLELKKKQDNQALSLPELLDLGRKVIKANGFRVFPDPWMNHMAAFLAKSTTDTEDWKESKTAIEKSLRIWLDAMTNIVNPAMSTPPA